MDSSDDLPISPDDSPRDDVRPGFERQRRQLLASSIVLALFLASGISLQELNILGNKFLVARPEMVPLGLSVVWGYFVLRFFQYKNDLSDRGPKQVYIARLRRLAWHRVRDEFERTYPARYWTDGVISNVRFRHEGVSSWGDPHGTWFVVFHSNLTFTTPDGKDGVHRSQEQRLELVIDPLMRARARAWVVLRTRYFTEYTLPVLVASIPFLLLAQRVVTWVRAG